MIGLEPNVARQDFLDFIDVISQAESVEELMTRFVKNVSVQSIIYQNLPNIETPRTEGVDLTLSVGLDQFVLDYFEGKDRTNDPAMEYVFKKSRPFWLTDLQQSEEFQSGRNKFKLNLGLKHLGDGILAPLYGPFYKQAYVYVSFANPREYYDPIFLWQIQAIFQALHVRYCVIIEALRSSIELTKRESEVLELITFGKTNPEIGSALGISAHTVAGHVKRIFLKFDASDRVTVALRARKFNLRQAYSR